MAAITVPIISQFNATGIKQAIKEFENLPTAGAKAGAAFKAAFVPALAVLGGLTAVAIPAVQAASDVEEGLSKIGVVFGAGAESVARFSEEAANAIGLSQRSALEAAGTFGTFGKAAGLTGADLAMFSNDFTVLAADLASFNNSTPEEAIQALGAGLRGESEPLRRFGILLDDATLRQHALELGIYDGNGALTQQQRVLAAQAAIYAQTGDAQGDFARTADGLANSQRTFAAQLDNVKVAIGQALLPVVQRFIPVVQSMAKWIGENTDLFIKLGAVAGGIAAAIVAINVAMKVYQAVATAVKVVQLALNLVMAANPIFLIVAAIAAIVAALVFLQVKFDIFGKALEFLGSIFGAVADFAVEVWNVVKDWFVGFFEYVVDLAQKLFDWYTWPYKQAWKVIEPILKLIIRVWETVRDAVVAVARFVFEAVKKYYETIWDIIKVVIDNVTGAWNALRSAVETVVRVIWEQVNRRYQEIRSTVETVINAIRGFWEGLKTKVNEIATAIKDFVLGQFRGMRDSVETIVGNVFGFFRDLPGKITGALAGIAERIIAPFRTAFETIKRIYDSTIGNVVGLIGGLFRSGGRDMNVNVAPSSTMPAGMYSEFFYDDGAYLAGRSGPMVTLNVAGSVISERDLVDLVRRGLVDAQRSGARLFV